MTFSSLIFLYAFLPLNLIFYYLVKGTEARNAVLLVFSLGFYAWGEPKYVFILMAMALADWLIGLFIAGTKGRTLRKLWMLLGCAVNIGILGYFKYRGFFAENIKAVTGWPDVIPDLILPLGISFYTFQLLTYVIDVYRRDAKAQKNYFTLLLYTSLYHQCVAGPIVRYKDVERQLASRTETWQGFSEGAARFAAGLAKKVLLANPCGELADTLIGQTAGAEALAQVPVAGVWIGALAYMLQIYLDFSAYSDMAIGLGRMFGITYLENFNFPYISRSITEFWRRWHMSLSSFFRDYVYIPLGGNRRGIARQIVNLLAVWFLTGLWHGASWNFVLWGLYYFVLLVLEKFFLGKLLDKLPVISNIFTLAAVFGGWILFRFSDLSSVSAVFMGLFGKNGNAFTNFEISTLISNNVFLLAGSALACTPVLKYIKLILKKKPALYSVCASVVPALLMVLASVALVGNAYNPFIYFEF